MKARRELVRRLEVLEEAAVGRTSDLEERAAWERFAEAERERGAATRQLRGEAGEERWQRYQAALRPGLEAYRARGEEAAADYDAARAEAICALFDGIEVEQRERWVGLYVRSSQMAPVPRPVAAYRRIAGRGA